MKNIKFMHLLAIAMVAMLSVGFVSCGKDDDVEPETEDNSRIDPLEDVEDPEGTIELSMSVDGNSLDDAIKIDKDRNFATAKERYVLGLGYNSNWMRFASIGYVKSLGNVNYIPLLGWADKVAIREGYGYVAYNTLDDKFYRMYVEPAETVTEGSYNSGYNTDGGYYQTETTTSRIFYIVRYQTPFKGTDEDILLDSNSLSFETGGGSQILTFKNKNILIYDVESSETWCHVTKSPMPEYNFFYNGLSISTDPSTLADSRTADVVITTSYGKSAKIVVTQFGVKPVISVADSSDVEISGAVNKVTKIITTNYSSEDIVVTSSEEWCKPVLTTSSAIGDVNNNNWLCLVLDIDGNENSAPRTAVVRLESNDGKASATLTIKQDGMLFEMSQKEISVSASAETSAYTFKSSISGDNMSAESNVTWCQPDITTAYTLDNNTGKYYYQNSLNLKCDANSNMEERTATVKILNAQGIELGKLKVIQEVSMLPSVYWIYGKQNNLDGDNRTLPLMPLNKEFQSVTTYFSGSLDTKLYSDDSFGTGIPFGASAGSNVKAWYGEFKVGGGYICPTSAGWYNLAFFFGDYTYRFTRLDNQSPTEYSAITVDDVVMTQVPVSGNKWKSHCWYAFGVNLPAGAAAFHAAEGVDWTGQVAVGGSYDVYFNDITGESLFVSQ